MLIQIAGEYTFSAPNISTTEEPLPQKCSGTSICVPEWFPKENNLVFAESLFAIDLTELNDTSGELGYNGLCFSRGYDICISNSNPPDMILVRPDQKLQFRHH